MKVLSSFYYLLVIGALWLVCSLPVVTVGASFCAMYYAVEKTVKNNNGYPWTAFFKSFKENFIQATIVWFVAIVLYVISLLDFRIIKVFAGDNSGFKFDLAVLILLIFIITGWLCFLFPAIARFENRLLPLMKNSAILAFMNLSVTIVAVAIIAAVAFAVYKYFPLVFLLPSLATLIHSFFIERIFKRYALKENCENNVTEEENNEL